MIVTDFGPVHLCRGGFESPAMCGTLPTPLFQVTRARKGYQYPYGPPETFAGGWCFWNPPGYAVLRDRPLCPMCFDMEENDDGA